MKKNNLRVTNFNLLTIQYPLTAIVSLLHRLSGIFIFLLLPFLLWLFDTATHSSAEFEWIKGVVNNLFVKFFLWMFLSALWYHLLAGIRHMFMDIGFGESLKSARLSSIIIIGATIILTIFTGVWLW